MAVILLARYRRLNCMKIKLSNAEGVQIHPTATRHPLFQRSQQTIVSGLWRVVPVEQQPVSLCSLRVAGNPTILVRESPSLEGSAARMLKTGRCDEAVDVRLSRQVRLVQ